MCIRDSVRTGQAQIGERFMSALGKEDPLLEIDSQPFLATSYSDAMKLYKATGGSGLIMNVNNGEILAMTSLPDFDPNTKNANDNDKFNKNTLGVYEFGSVMKIFTAAMGIEEKIFQPNTKYEIENHIYIGKHRVEDVHRPCEIKMCSVEEIFVESSNIGTIKMIRDIGKELQQEYLSQLGLLRQVNIGIPEKAIPIV